MGVSHPFRGLRAVVSHRFGCTIVDVLSDRAPDAAMTYSDVLVLQLHLVLVILTCCATARPCVVGSSHAPATLQRVFKVVIHLLEMAAAFGPIRCPTGP